ncbi:hypothetical protein GQ607_002993 [Colletotrichum asianum]|uniref:Uncharacterized protein n=1 Tax=Colletotrichum asianum TaxID=702518 RepID=A0A8H3WP81_9PEZI|nr:hypothetical protein GQ607_002993 [Colletotrichum asianum]
MCAPQPGTGAGKKVDGEKRTCPTRREQGIRIVQPIMLPQRGIVTSTPWIMDVSKSFDERGPAHHWNQPRRHAP